MDLPEDRERVVNGFTWKWRKVLMDLPEMENEFLMDLPDDGESC